MNRAYCMFMHQAGQGKHELLSGASSIRAMQTQASSLATFTEAQNYNTLAQMTVMGGYQYFSLIAKKGSMFLTLTAAMHVIFGKRHGVDPIMSLILFQRV